VRERFSGLGGYRQAHGFGKEHGSLTHLKAIDWLVYSENCLLNGGNAGGALADPHFCASSGIESFLNGNGDGTFAGVRTKDGRQTVQPFVPAQCISEIQGNAQRVTEIIHGGGELNGLRGMQRTETTAEVSRVKGFRPPSATAFLTQTQARGAKVAAANNSARAAVGELEQGGDGTVREANAAGAFRDFVGAIAAELEGYERRRKTTGDPNEEAGDAHDPEDNREVPAAIHAEVLRPGGETVETTRRHGISPMIIHVRGQPTPFNSMR